MPERILIRGANWVGDAVMTLPAVRAAKKAFNGAEVHQAGCCRARVCHRLIREDWHPNAVICLDIVIEDPIPGTRLACARGCLAHRYQDLKPTRGVDAGGGRNRRARVEIAPYNLVLANGGADLVAVRGGSVTDFQVEEYGVAELDLIV